MLNLVLKKISQKILSNQNKLKNNLFIKINNNRNKLILLDIGGAGGLGEKWQIFENNIQTIFIEPDKRSALELINKGFEVIEKVFWSEEKNIELKLTKKFETSSVFIPNREYLDFFSESERYNIVNKTNHIATTLDNQIKSDQQPDFIKIDIQGAELNVLKGGTNTLEKVLGLEVEVNFKQIYKEIPLASDVEKFLNKHGFILNDYLTLFRWERNNYRGFGEIVHADALFIKSPEKIIEISKKYKEPIEIFEKYTKILFIYKKIDLLIKFGEYISEEQRQALNLSKLIRNLQKHYNKLVFFEKYISYLTRYIISKDVYIHWKL